jgi:hypothetical protein
MVFNATFNNISVIWWQSVLLVGEIRVPGDKPIIHQSELRTYTKVVSFKENSSFSLCCIVTNTEWNGIIKIDN